MSKEENLAAGQKMGELINAGDMVGATQYFAPDCVDHDPAPDQAPGRAGFTDFFTTLAAAFPDAHTEPQALVADDDHVAMAYTLTGTHDGEFMGIKPTGKKIEARGMQIARYENGLIVERWGSTDQLSILEQLGATPKVGLKDKLGL